MADDFLRRVLTDDAQAIEDAIGLGDVDDVNRQLVTRHYPPVTDLGGARLVADALRTIVALVQAAAPPQPSLLAAALAAGEDAAIDARRCA